MINFIVLDTNIYRSLGLKYFGHIDYVNLNNFCYAAGYEIIVNEIVAMEYIDYFKKDLDDKIDNLQQTAKSINNNPYFEEFTLPELNDKKTQALTSFKSQLYSGISTSKLKILPDKTDALKFTEFLLANKRLKDSSRDYLIWNSLVEFIDKGFVEKICFISNDKIFTENKTLREGIDANVLKKIEVYDSISDFLYKNGFKIDFFTLSFLEQNINYDNVVHEFFKRPKDVLSYISMDYLDYKGMMRILSKEIKYQKVDGFYTYIDPDDNKNKFLAHIIIKPSIKFKLPADYKPDYSKMSEFNHEFFLTHPEIYLNTFDERGNPIYEQEVLVMVGGIIDMENRKIVQQEVIDFHLDYYRSNEVYKWFYSQ